VIYFYTARKLIVNNFRVFVWKVCRFSGTLLPQLFVQLLNKGIGRGKRIAGKVTDNERRLSRKTNNKPRLNIVSVKLWTEF